MNELQFESSPYLLQHAQNPVNWRAWNDKSLALAKKQNKLIIVSIGYSTCHWCHVMEHESFEDDEVAQLMNEHFISIKVDREERPDVDSHYMKAVQLMNQQGGWPLNVVCLPDGKPVWGGTYFRKKDWMYALAQLQELFVSKPTELYNYAQKLNDHIANEGKAPIKNEIDSDFDLGDLVKDWVHYFDRVYGGYGNAPKFMLPNSLDFYQKYCSIKKDSTGIGFIDLTLTRMAWGGLFDTVQGGFSRYSVDKQWHIPHFEKMLYDNAQLLSLYADGYKRTKNPLYKEVLIKTIQFILEEWSNGEGGFYSAYDADSLNSVGQLEEGAFYSWTVPELKQLIGEKDYPLFQEVFNIKAHRIWENNKYVLLQTKELDEIATQYALSLEKLRLKKRTWENSLKNKREERTKPRLDDKTLTTWNSLLINGLLDAYTALQNEKYLEVAKEIQRFISAKLLDDDFNLMHTYKKGKATIGAFLEDYAFYISALIALYEHTLNTNYLLEAKGMTDKVFKDFFDDRSCFFFSNTKDNNDLIHNSIETEDGVIPSANSRMAHNLLKLGLLFEESHYMDVATYMVEAVKQNVGYLPYYSNWLLAELYLSEPSELLICGKQALEEILEIRKEMIGKTFIFGSTEDSVIPYLKDKFNPEKTQFYYCSNRACMLPQESNDFLSGKSL